MQRLGRLHHGLCATLIAFAICFLGACAAPAPNGDAQANASAADAPASPQTPAADAAAEPKPPMRTGGPLPPDPVEEPRRAVIDTTCKTNADCTVKNVGNCCGYYPACVNVNSPTDPKGVQAECAKKGMMSACGFKDISTCSCNQGQCEAASSELVQ